MRHLLINARSALDCLAVGGTDTLHKDIALALDELDYMLSVFGEIRLVCERAERTREGPHLDRVKRVLIENNGKPMTYAEIARAAGIGASSVRMNLYGHKGVFRKVQAGKARYKWTLVDANAGSPC